MKYSRAPIVEAVLDVVVEPREAVSIEDVKELANSLVETFPTCREQFQITGSFNVANDSSSSVRRLVGYQLVRPANDMALQIKPDRWSFSKLAPYDCWDTFSEFGRKFWSAYRRALEPRRISRIGLRYVNRIDIPRDGKQYEDYFRTFVLISPELPQAIASFFLQLQIPLLDFDADLTLNMAPHPETSEETISTVLDLDIFRTNNVPQTDDDMWRAFDNELRNAKNKTFEDCLTPAAKERFK